MKVRHVNKFETSQKAGNEWTGIRLGDMKCLTTSLSLLYKRPSFKVGFVLYTFSIDVSSTNCLDSINKKEFKNVECGLKCVPNKPTTMLQWPKRPKHMY